MASSQIISVHNAPATPPGLITSSIFATGAKVPVLAEANCNCNCNCNCDGVSSKCNCNCNPRVRVERAIPSVFKVASPQPCLDLAANVGV